MSEHDLTPGVLWDCLAFFLTAELNLEANRLLLAAERCEGYNPPWARNLRRKAARLRARAWRLAMGKTPIYAPMTTPEGD